MNAFKLTLLCATYCLLNACSNTKTSELDDLSINYEIVNIQADSTISEISGSGILANVDERKKIDVNDKQILQSYDLIFLEKDTMLIIESPQKLKTLLRYSHNNHTFLIKIKSSDNEDCSME